MSLALRLTLWYAASASLLLLFVTAFVYFSLKKYLQAQDDQHLRQKVEEVRVIIRREPPDMDIALRQAVGLEYRVKSQNLEPYFIRIKDHRGDVRVETPQMSELLPVGVFAGYSGAHGGHPYTLVNQHGHAFRSLSITVDSASGTPFQVNGAVDHNPEIQLLGQFRRFLLGVNLVGIVLSAVFGYSIASRGLRPLDRMATAVRRIRSTTLNERIESAGVPPEVAALADSFNTMLQGLEDAFARLSRYSADIAHELRTPINNLRGEAEVALSRARAPEEYHEVLGSSLEEMARLSTLIDSLLFIARAENPAMQIRREPVDLADEFETLSEFYSAPATDAGLGLAFQVEPGLSVPLDRHLFRRAVGNLIENAIKYCHGGGEVRVTARREGDVVKVDVRDNGGGIPAEHLPHVFNRFYRVDSTRSKHTGGTGLGLAIVKTIATLHHGDVTISSKPGEGTTVSLVLPVTDPTPPGQAPEPKWSTAARQA